MKRNLFVFLMVCFFINVAYSQEIILFSERELSEDYDWFKPHINVGTLVEVDYEDTVQNILKLNPLSGKNIDGYNLLTAEYFVPQRAYKQYDERSNTTLYRLMFKYIGESQSISDKPVYSYQMVYYVSDKNPAKLLFSDFYHTVQNQNKEFYDGVTNIMLIVRHNILVGIMKYSYAEYYDDHLQTIENSHVADIYWIHDIQKLSIGNYNEDISIITYDVLIDTNDIFKYTIQNAFDGNPVTSYARSQDSYSTGLYFSFSKEFVISRIAVINGYAASERLYNANNIINGLSCEINYNHDTGMVENWWQDSLDKTLQYQIKDFAYSVKNLEISASINQGTTYNDTCIAEFNLEVEGTGWLFGGDL